MMTKPANKTLLPILMACSFQQNLVSGPRVQGLGRTPAGHGDLQVIRTADESQELARRLLSVGVRYSLDALPFDSDGGARFQ